MTSPVQRPKNTVDIRMNHEQYLNIVDQTRLVQIIRLNDKPHAIIQPYYDIIVSDVAGRPIPLSHNKNYIVEVVS